ncbi:O-methyltransferase [Ruegeria arenilitoris]|uniref:O-methyltransferase n=1 Tax=Ruegeria arenilitoris TaxID=1173585 RepID=UPI00147A1EF2|nr:class I SAM-dependent methyltransferase [Ruegeria arenilitoris]
MAQRAKLKTSARISRSNAQMTCTLNDAQVFKTLETLHGNARSDWLPMLKYAPQAIWGLLRGQSMMKALTPEMLKDAYIPVSPEQGRYLYSMAVSTNARRIVEFGSSFGIGTIYLAAAAKDTGGHVITTEIEPNKCAATQENLDRAGLGKYATMRKGDALETLQDVDPDVDLVFLDGWKDLYNGVLDVLLPKLKSGAIVIGDNINLSEGKEYFARVSASNSGFITTALNRNTSISVFVDQQGEPS